jgi:membrane-associated phospholipid phosphatase
MGLIRRLRGRADPGATPGSGTRIGLWVIAGFGFGVLLPAGLVVALASLRPQWPTGDLLPTPIAGENRIGEIIVVLLTLVGGDKGLVVLISAGLLLLVLRRQYRKAAFFLVAIAGARITGRLLKTVVDVPRPASETTILVPAVPAILLAGLAMAVILTGLALRWRPAVLGGAILIGLLGLEQLTEIAVPVRAGYDSFPSGHALGSMALALATIVVAWDRRRWRVSVLAVALVFALGVGLSRVYIDIHHPADVLAGWCVALAWVVGIGICWHIWPRRNLDLGGPGPGPAD